ncbi:MAG: PD40 domain-containing protein [Saprospiraceae bacterium]|nr:PD40 domain-containing protein [Saprospiraceae bacterium]
MKNLFVAAFLGTLLFACNSETKTEAENTTEETVDSLRYDQESHFKNLKQLTFGGDNAEAYFSFSGNELVLQVTNPAWGIECDQIFTFPTSGITGERPAMVSTGKGRTTCSYFMPGDSTIVYASTHLAADTCPSSPRSVNGKYVWGIYDSYDIFIADKKGNILKQLTDNPGYDAEATVSPDGTKIVFTSTRSGDLELYTMDIDGSNVKQVTDKLGYDGGAFFSPDSKRLVFRASRPTDKEDVKTYTDLLKQGLVQPTNMEIYTCNVDGSDMKEVTNLGGANWAPFYHPSGNKIIFSTNHHTESGRQFNLFSINTDGTGLEQITYDNVFDAFPMFSPDGKYLVFSSNRNNGGGRDTNVFLAEWED